MDSVTDCQPLDQWLSANGLAHLADLFAAHGIDWDVVDSLGSGECREIGVSLGDQLRLKEALKKHRSSNSSKLLGDAERRLLTVMFCDLVGSTAISQKHDPEIYRRILRSYQSAVVAEIHRYQGTVAQLFGDGFMVYFGFPQARENDAGRAVRSAMSIVSSVSAISHPLDIDLKVRIGVATGVVVIGDMIGDESIETSAVQGLTPNLSARLQEIAKENSIVICETTKRLVDFKLILEELTPQPLKGIDGLVKASAVQGVIPSTRYDVAAERGLTPFVGRLDEVRELNNLYAAAYNGTGQLAIVEGEAGIGKSRLVNHFITGTCTDDNCWTFSCSQPHQYSVFYPLIDHFHNLIIKPRDQNCVNPADEYLLFGMLARKKTKSFDTLIGLLSSKTKDFTEESSNYIDELCTTFIDILNELTRDNLCTVIFEDVHWADASTCELIARITQWARSHQLLILLTSRTPLAMPVTDLDNVNRLVVSKLSTSDSLHLIGSIGGISDVSLPTLESLAKRGDGVPLFLEELVRYTTATTDHSHASNDANAVQSLPVTLRDLLMEQLDRLGTAKPVAQLAAVIGRSFSIELLALVDGLTADQRSRAIETLERVGIFVVHRSPDSTLLEFRHALIQEQAYESLLYEIRPKLHLRIARVLEKNFPSVQEFEPETLALHFEMGKDSHSAQIYRKQAGDRARLKSVHSEAAGHYKKAIKLLKPSLADGRAEALELDLRIKLGTELIACHGNGAREVVENFERARDLSSKNASPRQRFETLHGLRLCYIIRGPLSRAKSLGIELLELAEETCDLGLALQAHRPHGLCLFALGDFNNAAYHLRRAIDLHIPTRDDGQRFSFVSDPLVLAHCNLAWTLCFLGKTRKSSDEMKKALARADDLNHPHSLAFALSVAASVSQAKAKIDDSLEYSCRVISISSEHEYPYWLSWGRMMQAWALGAKGDHKSSIEYLQDGIVSYLKTDSKMMLPYFYTLLAEIQQESSDTENALNSLSRAEQTMEETGTMFYAAETYRLRGVCFSALDEPEIEVEKSLLKAAEISKFQQNHLLLKRIKETFQP